MPVEMMENPTGNKAGKQKNQSPQKQPGAVINNEIGDDFGNRYLLGRQVAHEYYSPTVQTLIRLGVDPQQLSQSADSLGKQEKPMTAMKPQKPPSLDKEQGKMFGGDKSLEQPWIDPTAAAAGGFGGVASLSLNSGMALMPSLGRAIVAGVVGGAADYPIGYATEKVEDYAPGAALPFNVIVGLVSGATIENAIEKSVIKLAGASGEAASKLSSKVFKELSEGEPKSAIGKQVLQQFNDAMQYFSTKMADQSGQVTAWDGPTQTPPSGFRRIYRGESVHNKNGRHWTGDSEFARQFTQSGKDSEISQALIKEKDIYTPQEPIYAGDPYSVDEAVKTARNGGFKAVELDEGNGQPPSIYVFDSSSINSKSKYEDASWMDVAKEILKSEKGEIILRQGKDLNPAPKKSGVPESTKNIGDAALHSKNTSATNFGVDINRKYAGNINLTKIIQGPEDIRRIIAGTADQFKAEVEIARRGKVSWDQTAKDAEKYSLDDLLGRKVGQAYNDAEVENARTLLVSSSENLKTLRDKILTKDATDADKADFLNAFNTHYAIEMQVAGAAAEAGRALRAFGKIAQSNALKTQQIQESLQQGIGKYSADQIAEMMAGMDSMHQINKFVDQAQRATTKDMLLEAWINGLLSGPQTHAVNTISNTLTAMWMVPERMLAASISKTLGTEGGVKFGEARAQAWGLIQGAKDGFKAAANVVKTGLPSDDIGKLEASKYRAITAENVRQLPIIKKIAPNALQDGGMMASAVDLMGEGIRLPGRFLGAEDEFFKSVGYRMELQARAYRDAIDNGLEGEDIAKHINEILSDPAEKAPDIHAAAIDASRYQTFTKPLGEAGKNLQRFVNQVPGMKFLIPFIRTPANILKFAGERSPLAFLSKNVRAEIAAGGARRDMALAKMGMGTMAMASVGAFASQGMITGGGPSDPKEKAAWRRTGWQPYSIKVGDKYVSYSRVEPLGVLFGLAADFVEISGLAGEEMQPEIDHMAGAILSSISKNVTSKTWLQGISEAVNAFDDPDRYMPRFIQGYTGSVIPAGVAQLERSVNPELEAIYSNMDAIKSRIPGLSADMPKRRNIWGDTISTAINKDRGWAETVFSTFNPFWVSEDKATPIDKELIRLGSPISKPRRLNSFDGVAYEMTPKEYDDFIVNMNTVKLMTTGKNLKDSLNDLVKNDVDYKNMRDDEKITYIHRYFNDANREAQRLTQEQHPVMNQVIERIKLEKLKEMTR